MGGASGFLSVYEHCEQNLNGIYRLKNTTKINQSPKGNMWSAIPVALLCMLMIVGDTKQGSGPKGDKVCEAEIWPQGLEF